LYRDSTNAEQGIQHGRRVRRRLILTFVTNWRVATVHVSISNPIGAQEPKDPLFDVSWNMSRQKSSFTSDGVPDSETRLYEELAGGYRLTVSGIKNGKPFTWGYTAFYDGKDHAIHGRDDANAIEAYRLSDRATIGFFKKDGSVGPLYKRNIAADGSTLEVLMAGKDASGKAYYDVIVYDRGATK
jgi:hypothetical protein